jgi:hypothetical protein
MKLICTFNLLFVHYRDLKFLQERQKRKCEKLEQVCREKESLYAVQIQSLQEQNKVDLIFFFFNFT